MILQLKNNQVLNLDKITAVDRRKELYITERGRLGVKGWNVTAHMKDGSKVKIAQRGPEKEREAFALCSMINHMTIFTTQN